MAKHSSTDLLVKANNVREACALIRVNKLIIMVEMQAGILSLSNSKKGRLISS